MPRLPIPDGDDDNWGEILNEYLLAAHNESGAPLPSFSSVYGVAANGASESEKRGAAYQCSGTDDQITINRALEDAAPHGGTVVLSAGLFHTSAAVRMPRRTQLIGQGRASVLQAHGGWQAFDQSGPGAIIEPLNSGVDKTSVGQLTLDGNRYAGGDVKGIYYHIDNADQFDEGPDSSHWFSDIYILHTRQHGFHTSGNRMRSTMVSRVRVYNPGEESVTEAHGFFVEHPDSSFDQCDAGSCTGSGFFVGGTNNRFSNCKSWYSDLSGWQIRQPRNQFSACESQDNEQHGYYITTGPTSLSACHADSNSWNSAAPASEFDGFHIPWGNRIQLIGCSAYDKNEQNRGVQQRYGIFIGSSAEHCQVIATTKDNRLAPIAGNGSTSNSNLVMVNG